MPYTNVDRPAEILTRPYDGMIAHGFIPFMSGLSIQISYKTFKTAIYKH
jgi:hypothetical protein